MSRDSNMVLGWDIGGVNTKAACVLRQQLLAVRTRPYELQRSPRALVPMLRALAAELVAAIDLGPAPQPAIVHAVTMTAELSQMFRTKRDGVCFVLDAVESAFPGSAVHVYTVEDRFIDPRAARDAPLAVAAANWAATAHLVATHHRDALLLDVGTTTTDVIPIVAGRVAARGLTDPDRLASRELVYTGALRTPVEAILSRVPYRDGDAAVSCEGFALAGDVHVWRGDLAAADYTVPTPDGRPVSPEFAGERLARIVCGDREMLSASDISRIADAVAAAQVAGIRMAIDAVCRRHRSLRLAVVTGLGAFLGEAAARAAGLDVVPLSTGLGVAGARCAPASAVALLLDARAPGENRSADAARGLAVSRHGAPAIPATPSVVGSAFRRTATAPAVQGSFPAETAVADVVIKLGGGVLAQRAHFEAALTAAAGAAAGHRAVIIPGGGPFADAVRTVDRALDLSDDAAHWMAVLAMDQYAQLIAARLPGAALVYDAAEVEAELEAGRLPVLAPHRWLRDRDPLPHSWDVTSDSIAAWFAGQLGARTLVLLKPPGAQSDAVDAYFAQALPAGVTVDVRPLRE